MKVPAIVDEDLWRQAQICLAQNRQRAMRNTKKQYLLRSLVFCPCGRRWTAVYKTHLERAYYRCPTNEAEHWRKRCAYNFSIRQEVLEKAVWDSVKDQLLDRNTLKEEIQRQRDEAAIENERKVKRHKAIEAAIAEVDRKLGMLLDELLTGGFAKAVINQRKNELMTQRDDLEKEAQRVQDELKSAIITVDEENELLEFAEQLQIRLHNPSFEQKRRVLELLDLRVDVICRDKVKLSGVIGDGLIVNLSP